MKNTTRLLKAALLFFIIAFAGSAEATDYYVDQNNPNANDQNAGTIERPWKSIAKANQMVKAGDTVYIKAGIYNTYVSPVNSGTSTSRITYRNYGTDVVTISGANYAIYLSGKSYITVQGINASNCAHFLYIINGASHNIVAYCNFDQQNPPGWDASVINGSSQYNWIHHCRFSNGGECTTGGSDDGSVLDIGIESSSTDLTRYNLIEDCELFHGGHHVMGLHAGYNTVRNNYFHNEAWSRSRGNRTLYMNGMNAVTGHNIVEGNRFGYAARPCDDYTVGNVAVSTPYNILRYNAIYHSNAYALGLASYSGYSTGSNNRIYNNTLFHNGQELIYPTYQGGGEDSAIVLWAGTGNAFKNNLYYSHYQLYSEQGGLIVNQSYANNWNGDTQGNPLFSNASSTPPSDKTGSTVPDLNLQPTGPAIDAAGALTTVTSGCNTSTLVLGDSTYFQDGTYAPVGTANADWLAIGTVSNTAQISSITHSTKTVVFTSTVACTNGASVWLYKKSDGVRVLYGSAPDAGAYEYPKTETAPSVPQNVRIIL